jgi:hypothetical protein
LRNPDNSIRRQDDAGKQALIDQHYDEMRQLRAAAGSDKHCVRHSTTLAAPVFTAKTPIRSGLVGAGLITLVGNDGE